MVVEVEVVEDVEDDVAESYTVMPKILELVIERRNCGVSDGARYASTLYVLLVSSATSAAENVVESSPLPTGDAGKLVILEATLTLSVPTLSRSATTSTMLSVLSVCQANVNVKASAATFTRV